MAKLDFHYPESKEVWKHLEAASVRSHHNTRRAFDDFLTMTTCALAGGTMEDEYLKTVAPYTEGEKGKRACDHLAHAFGTLVDAMEETRKDILGDLFMGGVTFGENGQFYTPEHICDAMAKMSISETDSGKRIMDPCVGSGRMLLSAAAINPHNEFYGVDLDIRCVRMTAINMALRGLYGWVIHGNSLLFETYRVFRTGFNGQGVIADVPVEDAPPLVKKAVEEAKRSPVSVPEDGGAPSVPGKQLSLF